MAKVRNRYFVLNRFPNKQNILKNGIGWEFEEHEKASIFAFLCASNLLELAGRMDEEFVVFVGSRTKFFKEFGSCTVFTLP